MQQLPAFTQNLTQNLTSILVQANEQSLNLKEDKQKQAGVVNTFHKVVSKMNSRYSFDDNGGGYNGL